MNQNNQLSSRLKEVILNGTWIANTNFQDQLIDVNWQTAILKPNNFNSIAMLTFHIQYYVSGILNYFENGNLDIKDQFSFDLPIINSEKDWKKITQKLFEDTKKLVSIIEKLSENQLQNIFVKEAYGTVQRNIDGLIEHSYYHLGQLVLIKKIIGSKI